MKKVLTCGLIGLFALVSFALPAVGQSDETKAEVHELSAFHKVIYPIWHAAYPKKDYAALRGFAAEVEEKGRAVFTAELPGILRDKQMKWEEGLAAFKTAVEEYAAFAASGTDEEIWGAAEVLHDRYEKLVRIIRPPLKEVDAFHQELYVVYHRHLPANDVAAIAAASTALCEKAEAVAGATLPQRYAPRREAFQKAVAELLGACRDLESVCGGGDMEAVKASVERLHSSYQALERVFE